MTRSRLVSQTVSLHGIPYVLENSWNATNPPGSYRYSNNEVFNRKSRTTNSSCDPRRSPSVIVNGDRSRAMITNFFIPELNNHDVQELWFQQDGATCHTARATVDLLKDTFGDHLISRFGPVNWPPRSCDLIPLDYFCGAM
ncbi:uncharacterized protein TNCV_4824701 [Trichonephila clavipes]|nr:uncharacterized protein TNCV_4824701 [Trichonephila clavipes]